MEGASGAVVGGETGHDTKWRASTAPHRLPPIQPPQASSSGC